MATDRRKFLKMLSAGAAAASFPTSIERALAIPAQRRTGTIKDVDHIVILMQENRSFDHYFGSLRGVRGFGDPRAVKLPSGDPVWYQPNGSGFVLPFRPDAPDLGQQFIEDLPHNWADAHDCWNHGKYDRWVPAKRSTTTMAYLTRADIPYYYALADAFTVCDAYHCSFMGATDPNRYHMWTGWVGNDGKNGGPVLDNSEAGYDWRTYPELLQKAGISWKIYQDVGAGLDADHYWGWGDNPYIGNYGDNSLLYFHQYQNAAAGSPLADRARTGTDIKNGGTLFDIFAGDVKANRLPQVSWIVAPESYTEHPNWPTNYGAWYISKMLDALTANPEVWSKTAFLVMFDENDGFFDHVVPPTPPTSRAGGLSTIDTTNELFAGNGHFAAGPYGFGARMPMIAISPWSKGGWVNSEVFDHTSLIKFIEARFGRDYPGIIESNITPWRRAVAGDLTSAFDFRFPDESRVRLPNTASYTPPDAKTYPNYVPSVPADQEMPSQEPGLRRARAVPYELEASRKVDAEKGTLAITFANTGKAAAVFQVRAGQGDEGPWTYTVGPKDKVSDTWDFAAKKAASYDLSVYGPNGFMRAFKGGFGRDKANLDITCNYLPGRGGIELAFQNRGNAGVELAIWDAYKSHRTLERLHPRERLVRHFELAASFGWYDFTIEVDGDASFVQQLAGHLETGHDSVSDPALGTPC